jgi:hypothetical protein
MSVSHANANNTFIKFFSLSDSTYQHENKGNCKS